MKNAPVVSTAADIVGGVRPGTAGRAQTTPIGDYVALTKPRLNFLVVATSAAGYYLGAHAAPDLLQMTFAVAGTALVAGGAAALNQVYERDTDALMRRTRLRPLPDGRVAPADARIFGFALSALGLVLLAARANLLAAGARAGDAGRVPGRLHADEAAHVARHAGRRGAWRAAAAHRLGGVARLGIGVGGAALFAIVFLWQIPHFMAIAWLYRDDYAQGRLPDAAGRRARGTPCRPAGAAVRDCADAGEPRPDARRRQRHGRTSASRWCSASALLWLAARFAVARTERDRACAVLRLDHLPAAPVDRDDRRQTCIVSRRPELELCTDDMRPRSSGGQRRLNALSGDSAARRLRPDSRAPDRAASEVHDRRVHHIVVVSRLLRRLPRAGRIGAVHAAGFVRPLYFTILDHARHAGGGGAAAGAS